MHAGLVPGRDKNTTPSPRLRYGSPALMYAFLYYSSHTSCTTGLIHASNPHASSVTVCIGLHSSNLHACICRSSYTFLQPSFMPLSQHPKVPATLMHAYKAHACLQHSHMPTILMHASALMQAYNTHTCLNTHACL